MPASTEVQNSAVVPAGLQGSPGTDAGNLSRQGLFCFNQGLVIKTGDQQSENTNPYPVTITGFEGTEAVHSWSLGSLVTHSASCLRSLEHLGLVAGSRIVLIAHNSPAWLAIAEACWLADFTLIPLTPDLALAQARTIVDQLQPDLLILGQAQSGRWQFLAGLCAVPCCILTEDHAAQLLPLPDVAHGTVCSRKVAPLLCPDGNQACLVFHSSGSTGAPKTIVYSKPSLQTYLQHQRILFERFPDAPGPEGLPGLTARLNVLPLAHFGGLSYCLQTLQAGRSLILLNHYDTQQYARVIVGSGTGFLLLVPGQLRELLECRHLLHGHALQHCLVMGESASPGLLDRARQQLGVKVFSAYGMSECITGLLHSPDMSGAMPAGSCGVHGFGEIKLVDSQGLESSTLGELWVRNPTTGCCYLNPELNARKYVDGWFRTGDCLYRDRQGYFFYQGRVDELLVINGRNLYPREVEELMVAHEAVKSCLARVFNAGGNMKLGMLVVLHSHQQVSILELLDFYLACGAVFATPNWIVFRPDLPRLPSGKHDRMQAAAVLEHDYSLHTHQHVVQ